MFPDEQMQATWERYCEIADKIDAGRATRQQLPHSRDLQLTTRFSPATGNPYRTFIFRAMLGAPMIEIPLVLAIAYVQYVEQHAITE